MRTPLSKPQSVLIDKGRKMDPVRTCVGCRVRASKSSLVRVVFRDSELVVDETATLPGRGAWLHPTIQCYQKSITRRAFGRALKVKTALDGETLKQYLTASVAHTEPYDSREQAEWHSEQIMSDN